MNAYRTLSTEFYDLDKPAAPGDAYAFFRACAIEASGPILEPMCGSGRFLVPLAVEGFDIDGFDASPTMLAACARRAEAAGVKPDLRDQFIDQFVPRRRYALAFIPTGSFCLLTDPEIVRRSLARLIAALLPGGKLILEVERMMSTEDASWGWGGRWIDRPDGAKIVLSWLGRYDAATRTTHNLGRYELVKDGRLLETEFEETSLRLYEPSEIAGLLREAGFVDVEVHRCFERRALADKDEVMVVHGRRPIE